MAAEQPKDAGFHYGGFVFYEDGSFERRSLPDLLAGYGEIAANPEFVDGVASRDVVLNKEIDLWVRIFHPQIPQDCKLPVLIYFHGGGFVYLNPAVSLLHNFCEILSKKLGAVVVSVSYRLAPEHRLPAAYEDGYSVLEWITKRSSGEQEHREQQQEELDQSIFAAMDLSKIFIGGDSAGGNIAAYLALRAAKEGLELAGQILLCPFYGSVARTRSELNNSSEELEFSDFMWKVSLPKGADRDHPYCNPAVELFGELTKLGAGRLTRALVVAGGRDPFLDTQVEFVEILERAGAAVKLIEYEHAVHNFFLDPANEQDTANLLDALVNFFRDI